MTDIIHRSHFANQLNEKLVGQSVRIGGWIEDNRDIGRLAFLIVRDLTGTAQAIVTGDKNLQMLKNTPRQSVVIISGVVQNSKAKDFLIELKVEELIVLSRFSSSSTDRSNRKN